MTCRCDSGGRQWLLEMVFLPIVGGVGGHEFCGFVTLRDAAGGAAHFMRHTAAMPAGRRKTIPAFQFGQCEEGADEGFLAASSASARSPSRLAR